MKRMLRSCALAAGIALAVGLAIPGAALAATVTINPVVDSWAQPGNDQNPAATELNVQNTGASQRTYLKFDLSAAGIPAGSTIVGASLKMYITQAPAAQRTYNLATSTNTTWDGNTLNLQNNVPPSVVVASVLTGTVNNDMTWTNPALQTAVSNAIAGNLSLVVLDSNETGAGRQTKFASNETALSPAAGFAPRLVIDYTPPVACTEGTISITRNEYTGDNPIAWEDARGEKAFEIEFTVEAGCKALTDVKVQGGMASNTKTYLADVVTTSGEAITFPVGRNNHIFVWTIEEVPAFGSESITIPVSADFNPRGKPSCGVKNLTGDWSARGFWDNDGLPAEAKDEVGKFVVEILCPE